MLGAGIVRARRRSSDRSEPKSRPSGTEPRTEAIPPAPPPMVVRPLAPDQALKVNCRNPGRERAQSGRRPVPVQGQCRGTHAGAQLPCQRRLLRGRQPGRRRRARRRAGRAQPGPPPGLPGTRLRRRLSGLDPADRLPVHLHLRRLARTASLTPTAGAARCRSRRRRSAGRSTHRSAGRPIITPIMSFPTGPRPWPRTRSSARTFSTAGPGSWGQPAAFTKAYAGREPSAAALRTAALAVAAHRAGLRPGPARRGDQGHPGRRGAEARALDARRQARRGALQPGRARGVAARRRTRTMTRSSRCRTISNGRCRARPSRKTSSRSASPAQRRPPAPAAPALIRCDGAGCIAGDAARARFPPAA